MAMTSCPIDAAKTTTASRSRLCHLVNPSSEASTEAPQDWKTHTKQIQKKLGEKKLKDDWTRGAKNRWDTFQKNHLDEDDAQSDSSCQSAETDVTTIDESASLQKGAEKILHNREQTRRQYWGQQLLNPTFAELMANVFRDDHKSIVSLLNKRNSKNSKKAVVTAAQIYSKTNMRWCSWHNGHKFDMQVIHEERKHDSTYWNYGKQPTPGWDHPNTWTSWTTADDENANHQTPNTQQWWENKRECAQRGWATDWYAERKCSNHMKTEEPGSFLERVIEALAETQHQGDLPVLIGPEDPEHILGTSAPRYVNRKTASTHIYMMMIDDVTKARDAAMEWHEQHASNIEEPCWPWTVCSTCKNLAHHAIMVNERRWRTKSEALYGCSSNEPVETEIKEWQ